MDNNFVCFFCHSKTEITKCQHCQDDIWFCSPSHEKIHRPPGIEKCLPFRSERNDHYGRHLVAIRDINPGEVVILDEAITIVPEPKPVCLGCFKPLLLKDHFYPCSKCTFPLCGVKCEDNPLHSDNECKFFAGKIKSQTEFPPSFIYSCLGILRLILAQLESQSVKEDISRMESHIKLWLENSDEKEALQRTAVLVEKMLDLSKVSLDDIHHAYGVLKTNGMAYRDLPGIALYPVISICSHECSANLDALVQLGSKFGFRAMRKISKGEQLTIRYRPVLEHRLTLRMNLKQKWMFDCECEKCRDGSDLGTFLSSPLCPSCDEPLTPIDALSYESDWSCIACGSRKSSQEVIEICKEAEQFANESNQSQSAIIEAIKTLEKQFHKNFYVILKLKLELIDRWEKTATEKEELELALDFCHQALKIVSKLDQGQSNTRSALLSKCMSIKVRLLKSKFEENDSSDHCVNLA